MTTDITPSRIDLHTHTRASDGQDSPAELVNFATQQGVSVLGVTDHDTVDALPAVQEAADAAGITLVPGVELSTTVDRAEVHILGYFVDVNDEAFRLELRRLAESRVRRVIQMIDKLHAMGIMVDRDAIMVEAEEGSIGRPHVARALIAVGEVETVNEAFDRYLKAGRPAYVPREPFTPEDAVRLLTSHGAIPVLAHPFSTKDPEGYAARLAGLGLRGFETYYAEYPPEDHAYLREIADRHNLIPTGGSDYHGVGFREGRVLGSVPVPEDVWTRLQDAHQMEQPR